MRAAWELCRRLGDPAELLSVEFTYSSSSFFERKSWPNPQLAGDLSPAHGGGVELAGDDIDCRPVANQFEVGKSFAVD